MSKEKTILRILSKTIINKKTLVKNEPSKTYIHIVKDPETSNKCVYITHLVLLEDFKEIKTTCESGFVAKKTFKGKVLLKKTYAIEIATMMCVFDLLNITLSYEELEEAMERKRTFKIRRTKYGNTI